MRVPSLSLLFAAATAIALPNVCGAQTVGSTWLNPILPGFHPDPSCIFHRPDETFYCASSSFNVFPGIPIHASKDLVRWRLVGHALNRASQLPSLAESIGSTSGIWAPALRFHNGTFFLLTTMVHDKRADSDSSRWDNIIFSTTDLWDERKWSNAVHLDFEGYDISPYWDDEGNAYVVGSHAWKVAYGIHINRVDLATGALVGNWTNLWNGTGGIAPEGPHIFKKDGWYYLMIAEGGTGLLHMETMARSRYLYGPYEANPENPLLSNANTTEYFQAVGHADLFQDSHGKWWGVALAVRSGPEWTTFPMGRETVLYNVTWERDSWPLLQNPVQGEMRGWELPGSNQDAAGEGPLVDSDDTDIVFPPNTTLPRHFIHWRPPYHASYTISPPSHENSLCLSPSRLNLTGHDGNSPGAGGQTFIARRQAHTLFTFAFDLVDYNPTAASEEAGITLFLTQNHHARMGVVLLPSSSSSSPSGANSTSTSDNSGDLIPYFRFHAMSYIPVPPDTLVPVPEAWRGKTITLALRAVNVTHYAFSAGLAGGGGGGVRDIAVVGGDVVSWGFTGALVGAYATRNGGEGDDEEGGEGERIKACITRWRYQGWGQVREDWNGTGIF